MKLLTILLTIAIAVTFVCSAMAVPTGKTAEFAGGSMGKVVFDGKIHADKGLKCNDCHTKIFPMKKPGAEGSAKIASPHKAGDHCFACHDGKKAFTFEGNCTKCHKK